MGYLYVLSAPRPKTYRSLVAPSYEKGEGVKSGGKGGRVVYGKWGHGWQKKGSTGWRELLFHFVWGSDAPLLTNSNFIIERPLLAGTR